MIRLVELNEVFFLEMKSNNPFGIEISMFKTQTLSFPSVSCHYGSVFVLLMNTLGGKHTII